MYHVILAGGSGSRFWPKSRKNKPKQLLNILGEDTMIGLTVKRLMKISNPEQILIVASNQLCKLIQTEIKEIPKQNYIVEPSGKNTAPAIGLAALHVYHRDQNAVMGVYPADHLIQGESEYFSALKEAEETAKNNAVLMTLGVQPSFPSTGYGYIQFDGTKNGISENVFKVKTFAEKPHLETAEKFIKSGEFLWNSGMFIWQAKLILLEMKTFMCELHDSLDAIYDALGTDKYDIVLDREWELIQPESIDYGILEKAKNVHTIKANFEWNDLGSWKALFDILSSGKKNVIDGDVLSISSSNNLVISPYRLTAVVGVENMAVINLDDATLVVPLSMSEGVKDVVKMLESMNKDEYL
jgi:mannose-1-phosphate guanylyltransferase